MDRKGKGDCWFWWWWISQHGVCGVWSCEQSSHSFAWHRFRGKSDSAGHVSGGSAARGTGHRTSTQRWGCSGGGAAPDRPTRAARASTSAHGISPGLWLACTQLHIFGDVCARGPNSSAFPFGRSGSSCSSALKGWALQPASKLQYLLSKPLTLDSHFSQATILCRPL